MQSNDASSAIRVLPLRQNDGAHCAAVRGGLRMALVTRSLKELKSGVILEVSLAALSNSCMRKHVANNGLLHLII